MWTHSVHDLLQQPSVIASTEQKEPKKETWEQKDWSHFFLINFAWT